MIVYRASISPRLEFFSIFPSLVATPLTAAKSQEHDAARSQSLSHRALIKSITSHGLKSILLTTYLGLCFITIRCERQLISRDENALYSIERAAVT